jgi:hypothetical protein
MALDHDDQRVWQHAGHSRADRRADYHPEAEHPEDRSGGRTRGSQPPGQGQGVRLSARLGGGGAARSFRLTPLLEDPGDRGRRRLRQRSAPLTALDAIPLVVRQRGTAFGALLNAWGLALIRIHDSFPSLACPGVTVVNKTWIMASATPVRQRGNTMVTTPHRAVSILAVL